ncbi:MAG: hypothetical protein GFH25_541182n18 [Chloroflexi bacterium AL-N10]|nr:hypothetical protein [Chloroflexi bacterium AL-N10]
METNKPTTFAIPYVITLQQPLLATALQGEPNSSVSFDYIPGSLIRGMFIQRYLKTHTTTDPLTGQGQALFFNGRVRYLNAYPIAMDQQRSLPTPTSLRIRKGSQLDKNAPQVIYHTGHATWNAAKRRNAENGERLNPVAHPFCYLDATDGQITFYTPERTLALHTQRNRHKGRATTAEGEIFRYEALAAGQTFCGAILIDADRIDDALIEEITTLGHAPDAWLGRSRSANYGQVRVLLEQPTGDWQEVTSEKGSSVQDSFHRYTLTLLSDMFLRDDGGHIIGAPDQATFHTTLAQYLSALNQTGHSISIKEIVWSHTCVASTIHGGFNRAWQLPLIQTRALTAGSMLTFTTTHELPQEVITLLEAQGLGERRAEGFGRVVVNWNIPEQLAGLLPQTTEQTSTSKDTASDTVDLPKDAAMLAQRMASRLQEAACAKAILLYLNGGRRLHGGVPNRTQLAYMRTLVQEAQHKEDVQALHAHIARLQNASTVASQQFARARLNGQPLLEWMTGLLERPTDVWGILTLQRPPSIAGCSAQRNDTMSQSVVLRLFDAVLAQTRREQEQTQ